MAQIGIQSTATPQTGAVRRMGRVAMSCGTAVPIRAYSVALFMRLHLEPEQCPRQGKVRLETVCPDETIFLAKAGQSSQLASPRSWSVLTGGNHLFRLRRVARLYTGHEQAKSLDVGVLALEDTHDLAFVDDRDPV